MRRLTLLLLVAGLVALLATAGGIAQPTATGVRAKTPVKVGFVYVDPIRGSGWTLAWDRTRKAIQSQLHVKTTYVEPIAEGPDLVPVLNDMINKGYNVIFATAFGYQPFVHQVAQQHPDVKFIVTGPNTQQHLDNVATVYANLWEARYVTGVAAGLMTKSNTLGFVTAHTIPSVVAGINGFELGARSVNPKAVTKVVVTNSWYDPPRATTAATTLAQAGADVIAQHEDSTGTLLGAQKSKAWGIGSEADTHMFAPKTYLTGTVYNWAPWSLQQVKAIMNGSWKATDYSGSLASGLVTIGPLNPAIPASVRAKVDAAIRGVKSGKIIVFRGPIKSNDGKVRIPAGKAWTSPGDVYAKTNFFVEGIQGKVQS